MYMERAKSIDRKKPGTGGQSPTDRMIALLREAAAVLTVTTIDLAAGDARQLEERLGVITVNLATAMSYMGRDIGLTLDAAMTKSEFEQMRQGAKREPDPSPVYR